MTITLEPEQEVTTPTVRRAFRWLRFWLIAAAIAILAVIGYTLLTPPTLDSQPLAADGTGRTGSRALVEVLREHGVSVTATDSLNATRSAIGPDAAARATVLVYDPNGYLDAGQLRTLEADAAHIVIVAPTAGQLQIAIPGGKTAGAAPFTLSARCDLAAAGRAGTITDGGDAYRVAAGRGITGCFPSGTGAFSLLQRSTPAGTITVLGSMNALTNEYIADAGNAALALNLLGSTPGLVWYLPSLGDVVAGGGAESLAQAAPRWIEPVLLLGLAVGIAAGVWRGRRFGPLVVERMPVVVRASETMEGRARLYQSASARLRALDALRIGTVDRLGRLCGLSRHATLDEVVGAVASATGRDVRAVRALIVDDIPRSDAALVRLSDELLVLEDDTARATRPA
ncbi:MAG: DUF4350 domain-containing protein [Galbitalea sp.]